VDVQLVVISEVAFAFSDASLTTRIRPKHDFASAERGNHAFALPWY